MMEWERKHNRIRKELKNLQDTLAKQSGKKRKTVSERKFKKEKLAINKLIETAESQEQSEKALKLINIIDECESLKLFDILGDKW